MAAQDPYTNGLIDGNNVVIDAIDFQAFTSEQDTFFSEYISMNEALQEIGLEVLHTVAQDSPVNTTNYDEITPTKQDALDYTTTEKSTFQEESVPSTVDAVSNNALGTFQEAKNIKNAAQYPDSIYSKLDSNIDEKLTQEFDRTSQSRSLDGVDERQEAIRQSMDSGFMHEIPQMNISENIVQNDVHTTNALLLERSNFEATEGITQASFDPYINQSIVNELAAEETRPFARQEDASVSEGQQVVNLVTTIDLDGQVLCEMFERYLSTQALRA